jgi:peroxiredoxin-like protein
MHPYPHRYDVQATAEAEGSVRIDSAGLRTLVTAAPAEFGGPGDLWSPETLLVAAAADCFVLTFRAIATASKLPWRRIACDAEGVLDRSDQVVRFTELQLRVRLVLPPGADAARAKRLLEKAEASCLISNSLAVRPTLAADVVAEG